MGPKTSPFGAFQKTICPQKNNFVWMARFQSCEEFKSCITPHLKRVDMEYRDTWKLWSVVGFFNPQKSVEFDIVFKMPAEAGRYRAARPSSNFVIVLDRKPICLYCDVPSLQNWRMSLVGLGDEKQYKGTSKINFYIIFELRAWNYAWEPLGTFPTRRYIQKVEIGVYSSENEKVEIGVYSSELFI